MRKRKIFEAMDRVAGLAYGPDYQDAKLELDVAVANIKWTVDRWEARRAERKARTPVGHDHPDWV